MTADPACATLIDGKTFAAGLVERVAAASARLESGHGVKPGLAVIIVGDDPASQVYVRNKGETTQRAGMPKLGSTVSMPSISAITPPVLSAMRKRGSTSARATSLPRSLKGRPGRWATARPFSTLSFILGMN
jgi:hypothetical protein